VPKLPTKPSAILSIATNGTNIRALPISKRRPL
jgi:hypothetical protein